MVSGIRCWLHAIVMRSALAAASSAARSLMFRVMSHDSAAFFADRGTVWSALAFWQATSYARHAILLRTDSNVASTPTRRKNGRSPWRTVRGAAAAIAPRPSRVGKVRKAFWLNPRLLDEARASLGAASEREAVEMALDLVGFRKDLARGARALRRLTLARID
jgi:hypothetical protein